MENSTENMTSCSLCRCVGYGYVPFQTLDETYPAAKALRQGTIFPELDLTIDEYGKVCKEGGNR